MGSDVPHVHARIASDPKPKSRPGELERWPSSWGQVTPTASLYFSFSLF
jgi:hypothetical protein